VVLKKAGVNVARLVIIHLNKKYVRDGDIFVKAQPATRAEIVEQMDAAKEYLRCASEPRRVAEISEYSMHDIVRIGNGKKKLQYFVDGHFYSIDDVPDDRFGEAQANQALVHKSRRPLIDHEAIRIALSEYAYLLYFFDYESYSAAIPVFDGFAPYQRIPFQFSLHMLRDRECHSRC
jgi:hypothetical protein